MRVGIGMSGLMHKYGIMDSYLNASVGLIDHITSEYEAEILLIPHVIQDDPMRDDLSVCQQVAARVNRKSQCHALPETLNACELKFCISRCDYFVGARTHSTIASLSSLVPTLSIGYSVKAWGINRDLLGCDDYVLDVQSLSTAALIDRFTQLQKRRDHIVRKLQVSVPTARESARRARQYLESLVAGDDECPR
jgi:polysaccharide pyruvyl transferase WcaK-like protein